MLVLLAPLVVVEFGPEVKTKSEVDVVENNVRAYSPETLTSGYKKNSAPAIPFKPIVVGVPPFVSD